MTKPQVKAQAKQWNLPSAESAESQDVCFVTPQNRTHLIEALCADALVPGSIVTSEGRRVGTHTGIANYTVGQRKGLGVGGLDEPYYVTEIQPDTKSIIIDKHAAGKVCTLACRDIVIDEQALGGTEGVWEVKVMARYRMEPVPATLVIKEGTMTIDLHQEVYGISSGQSAVCYRDTILVAGGVIDAPVR
jgi:tRNA-specific 2-thiouridylase